MVLDSGSHSLLAFVEFLDLLGVDALATSPGKEWEQQHELWFVVEFISFYPIYGGFDHINVSIVIVILDHDAIHVQNRVHLTGQLQTHGVGHVEEQKSLRVQVHPDRVDELDYQVSDSDVLLPGHHRVEGRVPDQPIELLVFNQSHNKPDGLLEFDLEGADGVQECLLVVGDVEARQYFNIGVGLPEEADKSLIVQFVVFDDDVV